MWFYSEGEAANFNDDISNTNAFISLKYKIKLLGGTVAQTAPDINIGALKNVAFAVPLKNLSNF